MSGVSSRAGAQHAATTHRHECWLSSTPLGRPVVPDVYSMNAGACSASASPAGAGGAVPARSSKPSTPPDPAGRSATISRTARPVPTSISRTRSSWLASVISSPAPQSAIMNASSPSPALAFRHAATAPARTTAR